MGFITIFGNAEDLGVDHIEIGFGIAEFAGIGRAGGRHVFGIKIEQHRLACQIRQFHAVITIGW